MWTRRIIYGGAEMHIKSITGNIGDFTQDCILVTKAEPCDDPAGPEIVWCNQAFEDMTGYTLDEIKGKTPRILQGPDTSREALDQIRDALENWKPVVTVVKNYTKSGDEFYAELSIVPVADSKGWFHYWVAVQRDVTRRVETEQHLKARNAALHASEKALMEEKVQLSGIAAVAQHAQDMITITDTDFRILWANPAFIERSGYPIAAVRGAMHCDLLAKRGEVYTSREMAIKAILHGEFQDGEVRNTDRYGNEYWTDVRVSVQRGSDDRPESFVVVERDITEQRAQREELERSRRELEIAAVRDPLTGELNRRGFEENLERMSDNAQRLGHGIGLMHIDLDHFKQINDTLGHAAGDAVLVAVTERIQAHLGPKAFAARIGGDEFVVAVELHHEKQDLEQFALRMLQDISRPVRYENADCRFSASIGISTCPAAPFNVKELMVAADIALYRAKSEGRSAVRLFSDELAEETRRKKTLSDQLVVAIENGDLCSFYHPQFDAVTGDLVGAEALVRWNHPEKGLVGPDFFLDLARELNLESLIDKQMLVNAVNDREMLKKCGVLLPKVSVNVSARRLRHPDLIADINELNIPVDAVSFELLESTFLDDSDSALMWTLDELRDRRIGIEIDDFGTGHASIMGLLRISPDRLKTDKSFLAPALSDTRMRSLFAHIVGIGKILNVDVTAEGVETQEHAQVARDMGCSILQGFYFARPTSVDGLIEELEARPKVA